MSLILPLSFFSSVNPPTTIGNVIYDIITFGTSTPYPDSNFYFGGTQIISGTTSGTTSGIGLLNASDNLDTTFKPAINYSGSSSDISTAVVSSGSSGNYKFIIGGRFNAPSIGGGVDASNLAIVNLSSTGGLFVQSIANPPGSMVYGVELSDRLYVVGTFLGPTSYLASYEITGVAPSRPTSFNWSLNRGALCVKSDGSGNIFIGGVFTTVIDSVGTNFNRKAIAKFNTSGTGSLITNFNPASIFTAPLAQVSHIEIMSDNRVILASRFNSDTRKDLIRLPEIVSDTSTSFESFQDVIGLTIASVTAIKIDNNGKLLACIEVFNSLNIDVRLYRFNISGIGPITLDTSFGSGNAFLTVEGDDVNINKYIYTISVDSQNNIILGGNFTKIDTVARQFYAVLDNSGALLNR
jgi:hypothetical protein